MYRHLEGGRGLNEKRNHARHTRTHRAGGVAGGVMHSVRYCVDDAVSINSDPWVSFAKVLTEERNKTRLNHVVR